MLRFKLEQHRCDFGSDICYWFCLNTMMVAHSIDGDGGSDLLVLRFLNQQERCDRPMKS
jgi:hypothetical protein